MKKIITSIMSLVFAFGAAATFVGCGDSGSGSTEGCLTIRYFKGGYGDEWLKDSVVNFLTEKLGRTPVSGEDYKLIEDASVTSNQANYLKNEDEAPDILMTQGGYETYIEQGLIENISSVYETEVEKLDGTTIKVKDYIIPEAYQSVTRQMKYNTGDVYSWVMPWQAQCFTFAYNETLLLDTVHVQSSYTVGSDIVVGQEWTRAPETMDELLAYFTDVNAGDSGVIPFGWSYPASLHLQFLVDTWWAQIQGTKTSKIDGEGSFYDFFNFNSLDLLDQTGIQMGYDALRSLIIDKNGNYINSDTNSLNSVSSSTYNLNAAQGRYAVWVAGDYFENESIKTLSTAPNFTTKMMYVPNAKGADGTQTTEKLLYMRTDEAFYIPSAAKNKDLAKEFLAFMCNESELLNYTKKSGGLRPFKYNPYELDSDYEWTEFQKSFFDLYNNGEVIMEYPANVTDPNDISPIYLYNRQQIHFFMFGSFDTLFKDSTKTTSAATLMAKVKTDNTRQFNDWKIKYKQYFSSLS